MQNENSLLVISFCDQNNDTSRGVCIQRL